jgi:hypothetical protein
MAKIALLIGVGEYTVGLPTLPAASRDVEAMKQVLQHSEIGGFDRVKVLIDPNHWEMAEAIETQFRECQSEDLVLLYFSGHGVKDESRNLYFAACNTRKEREELITSTAVAATFVRDRIRRSKSKRQVVILDCCFSGAFGDLIARDDGSVDLENQLGAEGQVVLTSSSSLQYSFEQKEAELSIYTHHLVEGLKTGVADADADGIVSVDELHEYASKKVQETIPAMNPKIIVLKDEGFRIQLAKAPIDNPKLKYRREAECRARGSEFSILARRILDSMRDELKLSLEETAEIEDEVLQPHREYERKLQVYKQTLIEVVQTENRPSEYTLRDLKDYQKRLGLRDEDVAPIVREVMPSSGMFDRLDRWIQRHITPANNSRLPTALPPMPLYQHWEHSSREEQLTPSAKPRHPQIGWNFWFQWVLATIGSAFVGAVISLSVTGRSYISSSDVFSIYITTGLMSIVAVSLAQWFLLKRQISKTRWWIVATSLGLSVGAWGIAPIVVALVERFWYKRQISRSVWWMLIITLSGGLSLAFGSVFAAIGGVIGVIIGVIVAGAIYGAITGKGIIWLLQRSAGETEELGRSPN